MKQVKQELRNIITDSESHIDRLIDKQYNIGRRGSAPVGAVWKETVAEEISRIDVIKDTLYTLIEECNEILELIENADKGTELGSETC